MLFLAGYVKINCWHGLHACEKLEENFLYYLVWYSPSSVKSYLSQVRHIVHLNKSIYTHPTHVALSSFLGFSAALIWKCCQNFGCKTDIQFQQGKVQIIQLLVPLPTVHNRNCTKLHPKASFPNA